MVKYFCDRCGREIETIEDIKGVDFTTYHTIKTEEISKENSQISYLFCDRCWKDWKTFLNKGTYEF